MDRIFILSPANCAGKRAQYLLNPNARFALGAKINAGQRIALADAFAFMSGLYFRGKWQYATAFASPAACPNAHYIITTNRGLVDGRLMVDRNDLLSMREGFIHPSVVDYVEPLKRDAEALAHQWSGEVVLLGSIATAKYVDILLAAFGPRLVFPVDFPGRGDLSRGGLMLRAAQSNVELEYAPVASGLRHGPKPPRLTKCVRP